MFKTIKSRINLIDFLFNEGYTLKRAGKGYLVKCMFHDDNNPSMLVKENSFVCFSCGERGSILDIYMHLKNVDLITACIQLAEKYDITLPQSKESISEMIKEFKDKKEELEKYKKFKEKAFDYMLKERSIIDEVCMDFEIGYTRHPQQNNPAHKGKNAIYFPIFNEHGVHIGGAFRRDDNCEKNERWYYPPGTKKENVLYNLNRAKKHAKDNIYICEGFLDVMSLWQKGYKNSVAFLGSYITQEQSKVLSENIEKNIEIFIFFDNDTTGRNKLETNIETLKKYNNNPIRVIKPCENEIIKDANDWLKHGIDFKNIETISSEIYLLYRRLDKKSLESQFIIASDYCRDIKNKGIIQEITKNLALVWKKDIKEVKEILEKESEDEEGILNDFISIESSREKYIDMVLNENNIAVKTGLWTLDENIKGLRPGQIMTVLARPGVGKTAIMLNSAIHNADIGNNTIIFSQEQMGGEVYEKLHSIITKDKINDTNRRIKSGIQLKEISVKYNDRIQIIERAGITTDYINSAIKIANKKLFDEPCKLIIVDYLQLLKGKKSTLRESMEEIMADIKTIAKDNNLSVIALSQVTRQGDDDFDNGGKPPGMGMAKESGAIEAGSDVIIGCWREGLLKNATNEQLKHFGVIILKSKRGSNLRMIDFIWNGETQIIQDSNMPCNMDEPNF